MKYLLIFAIFFSSIHAQVSSIERNQVNLDELYNQIIEKKLSMVTRERYDTIDILSKVIHKEGIEGDVVECGVWRGGMSIYMAYAFPEKKCWVCDSFQGFERLEQCKYDPRGIVDERHFNGVWIALEQEVRQSFREMGLDETKGVEFLPGWVNDTTDPSSCPIEKIAVLRIDVDAYSATLVVLENLYDKVVPGGFIIFDDSGLYETQAAIKEFEKKRGINIISELYNPLGNFVGSLTGEHGLYYRKIR
jgi:O-methyltransferase